MSVQPPSSLGLSSLPSAGLTEVERPPVAVRPVRPGNMTEKEYVKHYGQERLKSVDWVRKNIVSAKPRPLITETKSGFEPFDQSAALKIRRAESDKEPKDRKAVLFFHGATAGLSRKDAENYLDKLFGNDIDAFQRATEADIFWCSDKIEGRSEVDLALAGAINQDKFYEERGMAVYRAITEKAGYSPENLTIFGHSKGAKQAELLREALCNQYDSKEKSPSFVFNAPIQDGRSAARAILKKFVANNPQTRTDLIKSVINGNISPKVHERMRDLGAFKNLTPKAFPCPFHTFLYVPVHDKFNESFNQARPPQQVTHEELLPKFSGILSKTPGINRDRKEYYEEAQRNIEELTEQLNKNLLNGKDVKSFLQFLHMSEQQRNKRMENEGIPTRLERAEKALINYNKNQSLGRFIRDSEQTANLKQIFEITAEQAPPNASAKEVIENYKKLLQKIVKEIHYDLFEHGVENAALIPSDAHVVRVPLEDWHKIIYKQTESPSEKLTIPEIIEEKHKPPK